MRDDLDGLDPDEDGFDDEAVEKIAELLRSESAAVRRQGRELALTRSIEELDFLLFELRGSSYDKFNPEFLTIRLLALRKRLDRAARVASLPPRG